MTAGGGKDSEPAALEVGCCKSASGKCRTELASDPMAGSKSDGSCELDEGVPCILGFKEGAVPCLSGEVVSEAEACGACCCWLLGTACWLVDAGKPDAWLTAEACGWPAEATDEADGEAAAAVVAEGGTDTDGAGLGAEANLGAEATLGAEAKLGAEATLSAEAKSGAAVGA